jgi:hypothetical protein
MTLKQRGIRAEYLGSNQTNPTVQIKAESGQFDILFMTPEKACLIPTRCYFLSTNQLVVIIFIFFLLGGLIVNYVYNSFIIIHYILYDMRSKRRNENIIILCDLLLPHRYN